MNVLEVWPEAESMLRTYLQFAEDSKANEALFYSWEWVHWLCMQHPEEAVQAMVWLTDHASGPEVLEIIGCGHLQDLLWMHPACEDQVVALSQTSRSFYVAASWCVLDDEEVGADRADNFQSKLNASPFAGCNDA